jgi:hypothetical protein
MGMKISATELLRARQLEALGVPLDDEVLAKSQEASRGLWISQDPNIPQTTIFDTISGGTGVIISLSICNESDQMIRISAARLDIFWCKQVRWLDDPLRKAPVKHYYSIPMPDFPRFERDAILNHRFGPNGKLFPGDQLDGFLLGIGVEPIPDQYINRALFEARLWIFDGRNHRYIVDLEFLTCRGLAHCQEPKSAKETVAARSIVRRKVFASAIPDQGASDTQLSYETKMSRATYTLLGRRERPLRKRKDETTTAVGGRQHRLPSGL